MPAWAWVLLVLTVVGSVLWLLDERMGLEATERFGRTLAILFVFAAFVVIVLGFVNADWQ